MSKVNKTSASQLPLEQRTNKINFAFSASLLDQINNLLVSQWNQGNFTYSSVADFIRQALVAYQKKKIRVDLTPQQRSRPKKEFSMRWPQLDLLNFYYSLPAGKRVTILEASTRAYFQLITQNNLSS
jgi:hypothetical protein